MPAPRPPRLVLLAALATATLYASGCAYVSQGEYNEKVANLDQDGDGWKATAVDGRARDCDDLDPARFPPEEGAASHEIPYNGIDDDCDDLDIVDADGDLYPKLTQAEWIAQFPDAPAGWFPTGINASVADCDDEDADINPGEDDIPDDGIDRNCGPNFCVGSGGATTDNDYDQDCDGFVEDEFAAAAGLPGGDCDDADVAANPGVPAEDDDLYDGVDQNCDRVNDFDADGDGYIPDFSDLPEEYQTGIADQAAWEQRLTGFCAKYVGVDTAQPDALDTCYGLMYPGFSGDLPTALDGFWGDCQDLPDTSGRTGAFAPDEIHPGVAQDAAYDGVDRDCGADDDFDRDGDGYIPTQYVDERADYLTDWAITLPPAPDNDCDDTDPLVHPGVREIFGDAADQDCDGENDRAPFQSDDITWTNPRQPMLLDNELGYLLSVLSDESSRAAAGTVNPGLTLVFDKQGPGAVDLSHDEFYLWLNSGTSYPIGDAAAVVGDNRLVDLGSGTPQATRFYVASQYIYTTKTTLVIKSVYRGTNNYVSKTRSTEVEIEDNYTDIDIHYDEVDPLVPEDDLIWAVGCGEKSMALFSGYESAGNWFRDNFACVINDPTAVTANCAIDTEYEGADTCFMEPPQPGVKPQITACKDGTCKTWEVNLPESGRGDMSLVTTDPPYAAESFTEVNQNDGWRVTTDGGDGAILEGPQGSGEILASHDILSVHATSFADDDGAGNITHTVYVAATVLDEDGDGLNDVLVAYGDPATMSLTVSVFPLQVEVNGTVGTYDASEAGIFVDNDQVFYAFSGMDPAGVADTVAWVFAGRAH